MIDQCNNMGLDVFQVQDIIEEKGIFEENVNLILDAVNRPNFHNPLKMVNYNYY
jgi:hypothetical protein